MKRRQSLRERTSGNRALLGLIQTHPNPSLAEMASMCGYDFLILDCEHGLFSEVDHLRTLQVIDPEQTAALVRVGVQDLHAIGRYLDIGADGIVVPNVETAARASELVRAMEYPPSGTRGFGASAHRATRYGADIEQHLKAPREGVSLLVMIESALGVSNVEEIVATEGVDGVFIGPNDLTASLGRLGDFAMPVYQDAVVKIELAAARSSKLVGTAPHPGLPVETLIERGHRLILIGADTPLIRHALMSQLSLARSSMGRSASSQLPSAER